MPDARDVILKHIAAVNDRDSAADPWAADAQMVARRRGSGLSRQPFTDEIGAGALTPLPGT